MAGGGTIGKLYLASGIFTYLLCWIYIDIFLWGEGGTLLKKTVDFIEKFWRPGC